MRQICILQSYPFFGQKLLAGAIYTVGDMVHGHLLTDERADRLITEGWAEEWHG
ncbi:MAG TPA: hypothetical protein PKX20_10490 [Methanothrix soehngenii]|nr:hypothetical protein [Methanothrix soehngenii]